MGSAATATFDDTRYLVPALTWQIAADLVGDCATTDCRPDDVRVLVLPAYALDAVWACHAALAQAAAGEDDGAELACLLSLYPDGVHSIDLHALLGVLERVLAVFSLDLPATREVVAGLVLDTGSGAAHSAAYGEVLEAWHRAGIPR